MKNVCIILFTTFLLSGCAYFIRPKGMTRVYSGKYTGLDTLINIEGYYSRTEHKKIEYPPGDTIWYRTLMFYNDGLVAYQEGHLHRSEKEILKYFVKNPTIANLNNNWGGWGIYNISGDTIKIKNTYWYSILESLNTRYSEFIIINKNEIKQIDGQRADLNNSFHFVPYPNRVDSTNWLLKKRWFWKKKK